MVWNVCVIGAGINGLGTARELQKRFGNEITVTIVAEHKTPDTTSDVAAGLWMPYLINDERPELLKKWGLETFEHMAQMERECTDSGAFLCSGFKFDNEKEDDIAESIYRCYKHLTRNEIENLGFGEFKYGTFRTTYFLEPSIYLEKLMKEFKAAGGKILQHKLKSVDELLVSKVDLIVNCAGLGSRELFGDKEVKPIRGQVIRVKCPALKHFYVIGDDFYCLPNNHTVLLGGTHDKDDFDLTPRPTVAEWILKGNQKYVPVLKNVEIVKHRVGLRPYRKNVRVELEHHTTKSGKKISIVHNYGQGGSGITMFYGCSKHAADLAEAELKSRSKI
ncbi:hypothetical protein L596_028052 [Steinernema carpocapsae]|uniref:FAD dependent oxidoreductase domain-containing protein n=1 Tax=Steinernema carpocapsae TaxID=34508 RepID=A0A4U5LXB7_STECR|nr:hypothetical protein L596_028052 [Steinernema carpocapsae]